MMKPSKTTQMSDGDSSFFKADQQIPALLVAYAPEDAVQMDRYIVTASFRAGRDPSAELPLDDSKVSKNHFTIRAVEQGYAIEDAGSTNGTYVNGQRVQAQTPQTLSSPSVIRAGRLVLVFHSDAKALISPPPQERFGMAGNFHVGALLLSLQQAAVSGRHVLLAGPSGVGKELCAQALASMMGDGKKPLALTAHNAARFTSEEEAASTLFGIGSKVFSNVDPRPGVVEQAHGGALFLDEIHNLPQRVQRSLLRIIEDGRLSRIGETEQRDAHVRFILAANAPAPTYALAHDLLARLRVVTVPTLAQRVADIPSIFDAVLSRQFDKHQLSPMQIFAKLSGDHYESLCLDGFATDNVRGLVDVADRLATAVATGIPPQEAIAQVFSERFGGGPLAARQGKDSTAPPAGNSMYDQNKEIIIEMYNACHGNISMTTEKLRAAGVRCSRRWLAIYADRWGLREKKKD